MKSLINRTLSKRRQRGKKLQPVFPGSATYWEQRYAKGGSSGVGSYRHFARFKAEILNEFVRNEKIESVIEFGCGDGNQLRFTSYPEFTGFDVSPTAVETCRQLFADDRTKRFRLMRDYRCEKADLTVSLDVLYHLIEDAVFDEYMVRLFDASLGYVGIYSSNSEPRNFDPVPHIKHRQFTDWISSHRPQWYLFKHIPNRYPFRGDHKEGSFADFYFFKKNGN